jgi:2-polyprenyl-6-methoxyphenol hydroxylase-like FAD-dependent oxidoreductase
MLLPPPELLMLDVAIIGGGPTGLSTALALMRGAQARHLAVFETDSFAPKGASIVITQPGYDALLHIDRKVYKAIKRDGAPVCGLFFKDFSGRPRLPRLARWIVSMLSLVFRILKIGIVRANAWHAVRKTLLDGAVDASVSLGYDAVADDQQQSQSQTKKTLVHSNMTLVELDTTKYKDRVALTFADGTQACASLVLACDGAFSTVRKCLNKDTDRPHAPFLLDENRTVWRGTAADVNVHNMATFYVTSVRGSGQGASATAAVFPAGQSTPGTSCSIIMPSVPGRAVDPDDARRRLNAALARFEPIDPILRETIDGIDYLLEHKLYVRDFDAYPSLASGHGRIAFLGDSAHPLRPTGEGVAIAFEDAWTLGMLAKQAKEQKQQQQNGTSIFTPELLKQYVQAREKRVTAVCEAVRELAESFYDDSKGEAAIQTDEAKDGKLKTTKNQVIAAMKKTPIHLEHLT